MQSEKPKLYNFWIFGLNSALKNNICSHGHLQLKYFLRSFFPQPQSCCLQSYSCDVPLVCAAISMIINKICFWPFSSTAANELRKAGTHTVKQTFYAEDIEKIQNYYLK